MLYATDLLPLAGRSQTAKELCSYGQSFRENARTAFCMELMEKAGVIVTPGASFGPHGEGYVRFALVLPPEKIKEAVESIRTSGI